MTRREEKSLFQKLSVSRVFVLFLLLFWEQTRYAQQRNLFSPEQRSANLEQTAPFVGSKLEHKVPSHVSQKEQLVLLGTKGPLQFKVLSGS